MTASTNRIIHSVERLRREFPLQVRIEAADPVTRAAYATVLQEWLTNGTEHKPPAHSPA